MLIQIAHDFTCPWCWIGYHQSLRLHSEFGVNFDWLGYELWPDNLEPEHSLTQKLVEGRPRTPTRLELAYLASDAPKPRFNSHGDRIHNALEAVEFAKINKCADSVIARLYQALWMEGLDINRPDILVSLIKPFVADIGGLESGIHERKWSNKIVPFDEPSYAAGVWNVPTFFIAGKKYAEQPYPVLARAVQAAMK